MKGGIARVLALWSIPAAIAVSSLGGCALFRAPPPPAPEPVAAPPVAASAPEPASAPMPASEPAAVVPPPEDESDSTQPLQRIKRYIKKKLQPKPVAPPPPPPPSGPLPIIVVRVLPHGQARGLLDADVQRNDGKVIGRAINLVVDASGKPQEVIVNLTGFMGVGDVKTRFPWSALHFDPADHQAPVTLALPPGGAAPRKATAGPEWLALLDSTIEDKSGVRVGRVVDVLLDKTAQPQALVFDPNNTIGPNRHNIAAEWSTVHLITRDNALLLQMDLNDAQIKAAPPYAAEDGAHVVAPAPVPASAPQHEPR
jgi:sporulation protein YlmC with PRC-barrel domain